MSRGDVRIGAELIGIDRINRLVADLQDIDRNKAIKAGLRKGAGVFIRIGRSNLRARNKKKTGNLMKSFRVRVKKSKLGALAGFSMNYTRKEEEGYGSHSWLVDMGTVKRETKGRGSLPAGLDRGVMPASYFWTDTKNEGGSEAIRAIEQGIHDAVIQMQK